MDHVKSNLPDLNDRELVDLFLKGMEPAFNQLRTKYNSLLDCCLYQNGVTVEEDRKDLLQVIWLRVATKLRRGLYRETDQFKGWLFTITYKLLSTWRKHHRRRKIDYYKYKSANAPERLQLPLGVTVEDLYRCIRLLPPQPRHIVTMHCFYGKTFRELGIELHRTTGAVSNAFTRALVKMRILFLNNFNKKNFKGGQAN